MTASLLHSSFLDDRLVEQRVQQGRGCDATSTGNNISLASNEDINTEVMAHSWLALTATLLFTFAEQKTTYFH